MCCCYQVSSDIGYGLVWPLGCEKFVFLLFILFFATKIIASSKLANKWFEIDTLPTAVVVLNKFANSRLSIWFELGNLWLLTNLTLTAPLAADFY